MNDVYKEWKESGGIYSYEFFLKERGYMKVEEWVPVRGFEFDYEVSSLGRVRNAWTGKILKQGTNSKGYKTVSLYINGTQYTKSVHRLVAESFIEGEYSNLDVNHKDGDKKNNKLSNLEFCTRKENIEHALKHNLMKPNGFGNKPVKVKCNETSKEYKSLRECSRDTGVDIADIRRCLAGKVKSSCKGYTFTKIEQ